jgi:hypothetical protein
MNDLNTLMHAAVDDERPDLVALVDGAVRDGLRLRRRRRIGYVGAGLAVAAVVAGTAVGTAQLTGGTAARELQPAATDRTAASPSSAAVPSPGPLAAGDTLALGKGLAGLVVLCTAGEPDPVGGNPDCVVPDGYHAVASSTIPGVGTGYAIVINGPTGATTDLMSRGYDGLTDQYPGITFALPDGSAVDAPTYTGQAVSIHLAGWKQVGSVADDKQTLEGPGGAVADIVWRPARVHAAWSSMKSDPTTWMSPVHDGVFVTIQAGRGTTSAQVRALGASLTWK